MLWFILLKYAFRFEAWKCFAEVEHCVYLGQVVNMVSVDASRFLAGLFSYIL